MLELIQPPLTVHRRAEPFVSLWIETPRYLLKTVDQLSELKDVLKLRAKIFSSEYGVALSDHALDVDAFDFQCDHLVIIDRSNGSIVGTYRLLCSRFTDRFYSQTEFQMDEFLADDSIKLELGRACIEVEHRRGAVLSLLWRGVVQYALRTGSTYLFGCSSVKTTDFAETKALYSKLTQESCVSDRWNIQPLDAFRIPDFQALPPSETPLTLPALFQSYLKAGAKAYGEPAFDPAFHCMDFLTVLHLEAVTKNYVRKYQL